MNKIIALILAVLIVLAAGTVGVFAARGNKGTGFVDENKDGACDNRIETSDFADNDRDGICYNIGQNSKYTDADGDGVCDNRDVNSGCNGNAKDADEGICKGFGYGNRTGAGKGNGRCKGINGQ